VRSSSYVSSAVKRWADRQRNRIGMNIRAFLGLEVEWLKGGQSWYESKRAIIRNALQAYLHEPVFTLLANTKLLALQTLRANPPTTLLCA